MKTKLLQYEDAESYIYDSYLRAKPFIAPVGDEVTRNPELTRRLLNEVGQPDKGIKTILVAGSKGKGSTSYFIATILQSLGYKVGLFTSPHLVEFTERIQVNGQQISQSDFLRFAQTIEPYVETIEATLQPEQYMGPIGLALNIAYLYYREQEIDFAVIEVGRGGRFDDANVLHNEWAVITSLFVEHMDTLGSTMDHIIWHKSGIVKEETEAVIVNRQESEMTQSQVTARILSEIPLYMYGPSFRAKNISLNVYGTNFEVETEQAHYSKLSLPLLGSYQANNVATAIKACEVITENRLPSDLLRTTLAAVRWPGRCEVISQHPTVLVDGAINDLSAQYVQEWVEEMQFKKVMSIVGVPSDKDFAGVIGVVSTFSDQLILSAPDVSHKSFSTSALETAQQVHEDCREISPLSEALIYAQQQSGIDLILIIGTQTFIGNAKRLYPSLDTGGPVS